MLSDKSKGGPIFIIGAPRSGTSMLQWALAQHPLLWGSAESDFLSDLVHGAEKAFYNGTQFGEHHWLIKEQVSKSEFFQAIGTGIDKLYASRSGGLRWIDSTPGYVLHYQKLTLMFPDAKFIHITRDGRQCVTSMCETFGWPFKKAVQTWQQFVAAGNAICAEKPENFLQVSLEDVVRNPERLFQDIYVFIEESLDENSIRFLEKPINSAPGRESETSLDKLQPKWSGWNFYQRYVFNKNCRGTMETLGY